MLSALISWSFKIWGWRVVGPVPTVLKATWVQNEYLHNCIAPEGTRGNVDELKTGFYYSAIKANVPLILVGFDWPRKLVIFSELLYITGDYANDMRPFYTFFLKSTATRKTGLDSEKKRA